MKNDQVEAFFANMKHAIRNHESVMVGGGEFNAKELAQVMDYIYNLEDQVTQKNNDPISDEARTALLHDAQSKGYF